LRPCIDFPLSLFQTQQPIRPTSQISHTLNMYYKLIIFLLTIEKYSLFDGF